LAGHSDYGDYVIDTHDQPVCDPVWALYQQTLEHLGPVATLLERDNHFPPWATITVRPLQPALAGKRFRGVHSSAFDTRAKRATGRTGQT
jgi:uncharacterized protein (UPF0276 family)